MNTYYARKTKDTRIQTLCEHSKNVEEFCKSFGAKIGVAKTASLCGKLHDIGKATEEFQQYLLGESDKKEVRLIIQVQAVNWHTLFLLKRIHLKRLPLKLLALQ